MSAVRKARFRCVRTCHMGGRTYHKGDEYVLDEAVAGLVDAYSKPLFKRLSGTEGRKCVLDLAECIKSNCTYWDRKELRCIYGGRR